MAAAAPACGAAFVTTMGVRPEIIKMAPVVKALDALDHEHVLVHSGQHYDLMMDRIFFRDMDLREPDHQFELKGQEPHVQVATTMRQAAPVVKEADLVITHGDTNTTVAGALLANKLGRPLAHVEAGNPMVWQDKAGGDEPKQSGQPLE